MESTPKFEDQSFSVEDEDEIVRLERLQSYGQVGDEKWDREKHFPRLTELREKKQASEQQVERIIPTQEQIDRFNALSKLQSVGGEEWTAELAEEMKGLYAIIDNRVS